MDTKDTAVREPSENTRREFLRAGTAALALAAGSAASAGTHQDTERSADETSGECRNQQAGMAYRRLGRTGMMISEIVCGGDPITLENYKHLERALERGLNYLDMAPAYNNGDTERAYGKLLAGSPSRRDKVFLTTKVSDFNRVRTHLYKKILDGLPIRSKRRSAARPGQIKKRRRLENPGYYLTYFPGQQGAFELGLPPRGDVPEFGDRVEGSRELRQAIMDSLEGSLKRVGTDHFDLLMCPHGARPGGGSRRPGRRRGPPRPEAAGEGAVPGIDLAQRPGRRAATRRPTPVHTTRRWWPTTSSTAAT